MKETCRDETETKFS